MAEREEKLAGIEIVRLTELEQFKETIEIQEEVWGFSDLDKVPARLFTVVTSIGGLALGAYLDGRMIAFSLGTPGHKRTGEAFLHSHMTGIFEEYQNLGLGRRIKLRQREEALALGYELIEWTFDPLEIRNAFFNVEKLGVVIRRYEPNFYGITTSRLHGGLPTDRLTAEWRIGSRRVRAVVDDGHPVEKRVDAEIAVPSAARESRASDPEKARTLQTAIRERFQELFAKGYTVVGYRRTDDGGAFQLTSEPIDENAVAESLDL